MLAIILLSIPIIFYALPASVPIWRVFLIVWGVLGTIIMTLWIEPNFLPKSRDPLAEAIDMALRKSLTAFWLVSGAVQCIRGAAYRMGYRDRYHHWPVVVIVGASLVVTFLAIW